ncbi:MAG: response regulator [Verrucomicrobiales bacterium]|nr:response regulator [Verrucomicrobiales bacterium]
MSGTKEDLPAQQQLAAQLAHAQRLESLGTLAGGVAHDLNNILAPILMAIELLRSRPNNADDEHLLAMLRDGARRGADIIKQLLIFGRGMTAQRSPLQPRTLLKEVARLIRETFPKTITLAPRFPHDLWTIEADPAQIHQVLLNLCLNARDAMPHGGRLTLTAENAVLDAGTTPTDPPPGPYVILEVADTGHGIPPAIADRIFEPFFTTKPPGRGTGLGLSTVLGIVQNHAGFVRVHTEPGQGARFRVLLPALADPDASITPASLDPLARGNDQFVLVVDDEDCILTVARRVLEANGYRVLTAANGAEAIVTFSQRPAEIRAVVTDMMMPLMDGPAFVRGVRQLSSDVRIVAMSGLPAEQDTLNRSGLRVDAFLMKPFAAQQLMLTLQGPCGTVPPP